MTTKLKVGDRVCLTGGGWRTWVGGRLHNTVQTIHRVDEDGEPWFLFTSGGMNAEASCDDARWSAEIVEEPPEPANQRPPLSDAVRGAVIYAAMYGCEETEPDEVIVWLIDELKTVREDNARLRLEAARKAP